MSEIVASVVNKDEQPAENVLKFVSEVITRLGIPATYYRVRYFCNSDTESTILFYDNAKTRKYLTNLHDDLKNTNFFSFVWYMESIGVAVESFEYRFDGSRMVSDLYVNSGIEPIGYYYRNLSTDKLEMVFDSKEVYTSLPDSCKNLVKSNFLYSNQVKGWVSRAKFPNLYRAEEIAKFLGMECRESVGEKLSFEDKMERKAERAEARADRYMQYSENAEKRGQQLQSGFREAAQDIAFVTQPNINSPSGRSFTRYRERLLAAYGRGFEEFKKSEYYADKAETAMATAHSTKPTDKAFILRREAECEKSIRAQKKNIGKYDSYMKRLESGEVLHTVRGEELTREMVQGWLDHAYEIIDDNLSKLVYYDKCMEELGGVNYSKENIKKGYVVKHQRWGQCLVTGTGPKNFTYSILDGGARGMGGSASYAEIEEVVSTDTSQVDNETHPFKVGETYKIAEWNSELSKYVDMEYEIVKVSAARVSLKCEDGRVIIRKPTKRISWGVGVYWYLNINDGPRGYVCKKAEG